MKKKTRKDKQKLRNNIRKSQIARANRINDNSPEALGITDNILVRMKAKMTERSGGIEHRMVLDRSLERMSDVLVEYAEPFLENIDAGNRAQFEKAIMLAMTLWNYSIMQETSKEAPDEVNLLLEPLMAEPEFKEILDSMIERKRQLFANNKRLVMDYEITELKGDFHLSIASTVA